MGYEILQIGEPPEPLYDRLCKASAFKSVVVAYKIVEES